MKGMGFEGGAVADRTITPEQLALEEQKKHQEAMATERTERGTSPVESGEKFALSAAQEEVQGFFAKHPDFMKQFHEGFQSGDTPQSFKGGEHAVLLFESEVAKNIVYKVNYQKTAENIKRFLEARQLASSVASVDQMTSQVMQREGATEDQKLAEALKLGLHKRELLERMESLGGVQEDHGKERMLAQTKAEFGRTRELLRAFGPEVFPAAKYFTPDIEVTKEMVQALVPEFADQVPDDFREKMPVWIMVQRRLKPVAEKVSFGAGYAERQYKNQAMEGRDQPEAQRFEASYKNAFDVLLKGGPMDPSRAEAVKEVAGNIRPILETIDRLAQTDPTEADQLRNTAKTSVEQLIEYSAKSGEILDFAGADNIQFAKETPNGPWKLRMPDPLISDSPDAPINLKAFQKTLQKIQRGETTEMSDYVVLMNGLNTVKTLNGFAAALGSEKRLQIPELAQMDAEQILAWARGEKAPSTGYGMEATLAPGIGLEQTIAPDTIRSHDAA